MKARLAATAAARLAGRTAAREGAVAEAQQAVWQALQHGDIAEALRQAAIVRSIRGPTPPSPLVEQLLERLRVLAEHRRLCSVEAASQ